MIKESIKIGFGVTIGIALAGATEWLVKVKIYEHIAKRPKLVAWCEKHDPELYEIVKKYL